MTREGGRDTSTLVLLVSVAALAFAGCPHTWADSPEVLTFDVHPSVLNVGDRATLSWFVPDARTAYLGGLGLVAASGTLVVKAETSRTYFLVFGPVGNSSALEVPLTVHGARGELEELPPLDSYRRHVTFWVTNKSLDTLLSSVHCTLQDMLSYRLVESRLPSGNVIFRTLWRPTDIPPGLAGSPVGPRRVSVLVDVYDTPKGLAVDVAALSERRRPREARWLQTGSDERLIDEEVLRVRSTLVDSMSAGVGQRAGTCQP